MARTDEFKPLKKQLFNKKVRTTRDAMNERDAGHAYLKDYNGSHVEMFWGWNDVVEEDRIFKLSIPMRDARGQRTYKTIMLDADEVMKSLRWV